MKLKRMWPGVCILVIFFIFDVVMAASSGFFSGLFPTTSPYVYIAAITAIGVAVSSVLTILFGKICDYIETDRMAEYTGIKVIYWLMFITIIAGGIYLRYLILSNTTGEPAGKLSLYENAMVGTFNSSNEYDILSIIYSDILNVILIFTGNKIAVAFFYQIALFMIFVICASLACKMLLGNAASLTFAAALSFMPIFYENISKLEIGTNELFYAFFGLELVLVAIFLKNSSDGHFDSLRHFAWYLIFGFGIGFMAYIDAGTIIAVIPLLLAGLFLLTDERFEGLFRVFFVLLGSVLMFFAMIAQEEGIMRTEECLNKWFNYFFHNLNTVSLFWTYTNYKILYLIIFLLLTGILVGYFRNREYENVSPWLLATMLMTFVTPFFGATRMNDQAMITVYFAFSLSCLVSLIVRTSSSDAEDINISQEAAVIGIKEVVNPDASVKPYIQLNDTVDATLNDEVIDTKTQESETERFTFYDESDDEDEGGANENVEEPFADNELQEEPLDEKPLPASEESVLLEKSEDEEDKPRFVPEGMVLPIGAEDEMDVDLSRMKMPEFEGKISLDRKDVKKEDNKVKKDDFDLPFVPGDEFDI